MAKRSKVYRPPRTIIADDFIVTAPNEQGEETEYRPHAGERVVFVGHVPELLELELIALADEASAIADNEGMTPEERRERDRAVVAYLRRAREVLAQVVLSWTWTDDEGRPLPKPHRNPDAFLLDIAEITYLLGKAFNPTLDPTTPPPS
jgi:hypothetical protein